jgi:hypothetical protein
LAVLCTHTHTIGLGLWVERRVVWVGRRGTWAAHSTADPASLLKYTSSTIGEVGFEVTEHPAGRAGSDPEALTSERPDPAMVVAAAW